jgi:hypothetical protein
MPKHGPAGTGTCSSRFYPEILLVRGDRLSEDNDAQEMAATSRDETLRRVLLALAIFSAVMAAGCSTSDAAAPSDDLRGYPTLKRAMNTKLVHQPNRYFSGIGQMPNTPVQIDVSDSINGESWIIGLSSPGIGSAWGVVDADSGWTQFLLGNPAKTNRELITRIEDETSGRPPLIINMSPGVDSAQFAISRPIDAILDATMSRYENLPDGMTVFGDGINVYSFADPTERYPHGALGDRVEWGSLVVGPVDPIREVDRFVLAEDEVFEGLFPLVEDIGGDGRAEIVTTVSDSTNGARLVAFRYEDATLKIIAESDPVGTGFRWLHQIAVAPFGPNGEIEIAVVETPHVGGISKFYRLAGDRLELVASNPGGYMSHVNGSRNLDQAVAGDFDGDGHVELLVPSRDQKSLIALRRVGDSVEEVWEIELGARLSSNLSVLETNDGNIILGAATENGILHIWQ